MTRSKLTTRVFRLSCGCVTEFSSLPAVSEQGVLCGACGKRARITYRYPGMTCGATCRADLPGGGISRVKCTLDKRHEGRHHDESVELDFDLPARLRSGREGKT